jgi:hypothetical protein
VALRLIARDFCRISQYLRCDATLFASGVTAPAALASLQACRSCVWTQRTQTHRDELDCRNRKFARTAADELSPHARQRPCGDTGLAGMRDAGKATSFTLRVVIRGSWSVFHRWLRVDDLLSNLTDR